MLKLLEGKHFTESRHFGSVVDSVVVVVPRYIIVAFLLIDDAVFYKQLRASSS